MTTLSWRRREREAAPETRRPARVRVMGILNVTPDSFSDGGRFDGLDEAVAQARAMVEAGADMIDIGGESTRPGHEPIDEETECRRVLPVLEALLPGLGAPVSIDTTKASVAAAALRLGACMVNDQWGLQSDKAMAPLVAESGADVVIMHNRDGADGSIDIVDHMLAFFDRSLEIAKQTGIDEACITLDPGIGFGKTFEQNLIAVKSLDRIHALGFPLLLGVSRKSVIGNVTGRTADKRLFGTLAMNVYALDHGVEIVRVHDVAEHVEAMRVVEAIRNA